MTRRRPARPDKRILYLQYTNPAAYPPVEHSALLMAEAGWDVLLLGTAVEDTLRLPEHHGMHVELIPQSPPGLRQKLHYAQFASWAMQRARRFRPSWIYASDTLSCPAALAVAGWLRAGLIYHEHDSPDEAAARSAFMRTVLRARRYMSRRAALCVLPNEERRAAFQQRHPDAQTVTVWNCPMRHEVRAADVASTRQSMRLLYHGSIVPARLPLSVIDALALVSADVRLVVAGYETSGFPGYVAALAQRARARGVENRVQFMGTIPRRSDLLRQCATCDVGLALMPLDSGDVNERAMVGASNKPFDYLSCGLALIVSDLPAWQSTFVEPGYALACRPEAPESIAGAIARLHGDAALRRRMGEAGRARILAEWNYDRAFAPVFALLNDAVAAPATAAAAMTMQTPL